MFIMTLVTVANLWSQSECLSINKWIKKLRYIYTKEFYSVFKKNKIVSFAGKWMELEITMLSETSQSYKDKSCMFSGTCGS
jgi:hypothetical protein